MKSKRRICFLLICLILFSNIVFFACDNGKSSSLFFSVAFADVGNGDCIIINLPNNDCFVIDSGVKNERNKENINDLLKACNVTQIGGFVLTHPDSDHIGNACAIVNDYSVKNVYIPNITDLAEYPMLEELITVCNNKKVNLNYSSRFYSLTFENGFIAFLSPLESEFGGDYYGYFNGLNNPSGNDINNLSPFIYLEYNSVRFLFTGDADETQEEYLLSYYRSGMCSALHGKNVNLYNVDYLKVGHHGSKDCSSQAFLNVVRPQNAVISCSGNNIYGHPNSETLNRLYNSNPNVNVWRTDVCGNVLVTINSLGEHSVVTQLND